MSSIELNDSDRAFLRSCVMPRTMTHNPRVRGGAQQLAMLRRIQRLQAAGLITGRVDDTAAAGDLLVMRLALTDNGRSALGLPLLPKAAT